jgi:hypothetical protein
MVEIDAATVPREARVVRAAMATWAGMGLGVNDREVGRQMVCGWDGMTVVTVAGRQAGVDAIFGIRIGCASA